MKHKAITLVETRQGCAPLEREPRYNVMLNGVLFFQLYFNLRGYVGYLPTPPKEKGGKPGNFTIGEKGISAYRKEIAALNKEWAEHEAAVV
jgi:hypothetical protein